MKFRYIACHPMSREQIDPSLRLVDPEWTQQVNGNGTMTASITVPQNSSQIARLRLATQPHEAAWYVRNESDNYEFGGVVLKRSWDPKTRRLKVDVVEWRAWFFWIFLSPAINMTGDIAYGWTGVDQLDIARNIATTTLQNGVFDGRPPILIDTAGGASGVARDLNGTGLNFKSPGELIDTMSKRKRGFEWVTEVRTDGTDGLPRVWFVPYYPERGGSIPGLRFRATSSGTTITDYGPVDESAVDRRQRQWATGAGQPPDVPFAQDTNPTLGATGRDILTERQTNYSTVINRSTLASHARSERLFYYPLTTTLPIECTLNKPMPVTNYKVGDRAEVTIVDDWTAINSPAARIITRKVQPTQEKVSMVLDLTDDRLPEVDSGGSV